MRSIIAAGDGLGWRMYLHQGDQILGHTGALTAFFLIFFLLYRVKDDETLINQNRAFTPVLVRSLYVRKTVRA